LLTLRYYVFVWFCNTNLFGSDLIACHEEAFSKIDILANKSGTSLMLISHLFQTDYLSQISQQTRHLYYNVTNINQCISFIIKSSIHVEISQIHDQVLVYDMVVLANL
jgi:hypothetical protein